MKLNEIEKIEALQTVVEAIREIYEINQEISLDSNLVKHYYDILNYFEKFFNVKSVDLRKVTVFLFTDLYDTNNEKYYNALLY